MASFGHMTHTELTDDAGIKLHSNITVPFSDSPPNSLHQMPVDLCIINYAVLESEDPTQKTCQLSATSTTITHLQKHSLFTENTRRTM